MCQFKRQLHESYINRVYINTVLYSVLQGWKTKFKLKNVINFVFKEIQMFKVVDFVIAGIFKLQRTTNFNLYLTNCNYKYFFATKYSY